MKNSTKLRPDSERASSGGILTDYKSGCSSWASVSHRLSPSSWPEWSCGSAGRTGRTGRTRRVTGRGSDWLPAFPPAASEADQSLAGGGDCGGPPSLCWSTLPSCPSPAGEHLGRESPAGRVPCPCAREQRSPAHQRTLSCCWSWWWSKHGDVPGDDGSEGGSGITGCC